MASTGYRPRPRLTFDGDETKFNLWEVKFLAFLCIQKMHVVLEEVNNAELIQVLHDRSLSLVMREAPNDGKKAFRILKDHYRPKGKPRIIALYTKLTRLNKNHNECMTDYIIRAETTASSLCDAGETVSDGLLIAMVLKGLPANYKPFAAVVTQVSQQELSKNSRFL